MDVDRRKELKESYKTIKTYMGVIQITNKVNGKKLIAGYPNLKNKWSSLISQLEMGRFVNSKLQKDWDDFGPDAFTYEILEEKVTDDLSDIRWTVKQMTLKWLEKVSPYEDNGYHNRPI